MYLFVIVNFILFISIYCTPEEPDITYDSLYQWGKESYTNERWYECVAFMKRALEDYKYYQNVIIHCQKKCHRLVPTDPFPLNDRSLIQKSIPEVRFFEKIAQKSLCMQRCTNDRFSSRPARPDNIDAIDKEFEIMLPYSYMQFCYWKMNDLDHAVSASYTFFVHNPTDEMMTENLKFYSTQPQFSTKMYKNLEQQEFQTYYESGIESYENEDFGNSVVNLELSLDAYVKAYENCRLLCINPYLDKTNSDDFYTAITKHFGNVLKCRNRCTTKLNVVQGNKIPDLIPLHFNYLQFAYWKTNRMSKSCEAVGTYLLFAPNDDVMLHNKKYYLEQSKVKEEFFKPRADMVRLNKQQVLDMKLMAFLDEKFKYENGEFGSEHVDDYNEIKDESETWEQLLEEMEKLDTETNISSNALADELKYSKKGSKGDTGEIFDIFNQHISKTKENPSNSPSKKMIGPYSPSEEILEEYQDKFGIIVTKKEAELNGSFRFFADHLLSGLECEQLMQLKDVSQPGSGYSGKSSPHTKYEDFNGLTIGKLTELVSATKISLDTAKLFFDKSELARDFVEKYFNLSSHLYIDYTHFVCRSTRPDSTEQRTDFSHPIHGDNCMLLDGRCDKKFPAFTWRDFSAIVYLNDEFKGGEFVFADSNGDVEAVLKPSCGQMVAFSGSTLHGVKAVTKGTRCVLALWMTLDPEHQEKDRIRAQQTLAELEILQATEPI